MHKVVGNTRILRLTSSQHHDICQQAAHTPAYEICGLIGGYWEPGGQVAVAREIVAIQNIDAEPTVRFTMEPRAQLQAMINLERRGLEVVAFYHSHPEGPPYPSTQDIEEYEYYDSLYLIVFPVRVVEGKAESLIQAAGYGLSVWAVDYKKTIQLGLQIME